MSGYPAASGGWVDATQTAQLTAPHSLNFGVAVSISGNKTVAGASVTTVGLNEAQGAVFVYLKPSAGWKNTWRFNSELSASDGALNGRGASVNRHQQHYARDFSGRKVHRLPLRRRRGSDIWLEDGGDAFDRRQSVRRSDVLPNPEGSIRFSPDGQGIAYAVTDEQGVGNIWVQPLACQSADRLQSRQDLRLCLVV